MTNPVKDAVEALRDAAGDMERIVALAETRGIQAAAEYAALARANVATKAAALEQYEVVEGFAARTSSPERNRWAIYGDAKKAFPDERPALLLVEREGRS